LLKIKFNHFMRILVTGSNGFVGRSVCQLLSTCGYEVVAQQRAPEKYANSQDARWYSVQIELSKSDALHTALSGCGAIIHTAARVHMVHDSDPSPLNAYRCTNTDLTLRLAHMAAQCGVKRFVFLSTIKVNGESTQPGQAFTAEDTVTTPLDPYALSKQEAEVGLRQIAEQTGLEVVIVRPPLVYGPGVKANFLRMMQWVDRGVPLPLGAIYNQRSLVSTDNLASFLERCTIHPAAANQTFLVSDGADVSTSDLLRAIGDALGRPARLLPVPQQWLENCLHWVSLHDVARRLCADLTVDIEKNQQLLNWVPPCTVAQGLQRTVQAFKTASLERS
jgi:UDP-glucose 4-epimerase